MIINYLNFQFFQKKKKIPEQQPILIKFIIKN